jgi:translation initiation factor IF-3
MLQEDAIIESQPRMEGRQMFMIIAPSKSSKQKASDAEPKAS